MKREIRCGWSSAPIAWALWLILAVVGPASGGSLDPVLVGQWPGYLRGPALSVAVAGDHAYVAGGATGLQVFNISDPANPVRVGGLDTSGDAWGVAVAGSYAYVADGYAGLQVINISDPTNCVWLGRFDTSGYARGVVVVGAYAYVADGDAGLQVINVSNPTNCISAGRFDTSGHAIAVAVAGSYAYVADNDVGLQVINVSNPASPWRVGGLDTSGYAVGVAVAGSYAYVADGDAGLQVINVSNPANPSRVGGLDTSGHAHGVTVVGSYAYVADGDAGLQVINVSNPASPSRVGGLDTSGYALGVAVAGSYAYVADESRGLQVLSVSSPANPVRVGGVSTGAGYASSVAVSGNYACLADGIAGLQVIDITEPANPRQVGSFETNSWLVALAGNLAFVPGSRWDAVLQRDMAVLQVLDLSTPANPRRVGFFETYGYPVAVAASGSHAYFAVQRWDDVLQREVTDLQVLNVSTPSTPWCVGVFHTDRYASGLAVSGNYIYWGIYGWDPNLQRDMAGFQVLDVSIPSNPRQVGGFAGGYASPAFAVSGDFACLVLSGTLHVFDVSLPSNPRLTGTCAFSGYGTSVAISSGLAFVGDGEAGIQVFDISDPYRPEKVGSCDTVGSVAGLAVAGNCIFAADGPGGLGILEMRSPFLLSYPWPLTETSGTVQIQVQRTTPGDTPSTVHYRSVGGTATPGSDYAALAGTLQFPRAGSTLSLTLTVFDDPLAEGTETIELELADVTFGTTNRVTLKLLDNEIPLQVDGRFAWAQDRTDISFIDRYPDRRFLLVTYDTYSGVQRLVRLTTEGEEDPDFRAFVWQMWPLAALPDGGAICSSNSSQILRLKPDGSVDAGFQSPVLITNGWISSAVVQVDGKLLVAVASNNVNNVTLSRLIRVATDGAVDSAFVSPLFSNGTNSAWINRPVLQGDGRILVWGTFASVNGRPHRNLARLNADGTLDDTFAPALTPDSAWIGSISPLADGRIYLCGSFGGIGGTSRPGLLRLNPDGSMDPAFDAHVNTTNGIPNAVLALPDGGVLAGGGAMGFGDRSEAGVARLRADGSLMPRWLDPPLPGTVSQLWLDPPNGVVLQSVEWDTSGYPSSRLTRVVLDNTGLVGVRFSPSEATMAEPAGAVDIVVERLGDTLGSLQVDLAATGSARRGADFTLPSTVTFAPFQTRQTIRTQLLDDGAVEGPEEAAITLTSTSSSFVPGNRLRIRIEDNERPVVLDPGVFGMNPGHLEISAVLPLTDGGTLLAARYPGTIWRLLPDGRIDSDFAAPSFDSDILSLALTAEGKLLVGGYFGMVGSSNYPGLVRLDATGQVDSSFLPEPASGTRVLRVQPDGKILMASDNGLQRLLPDGRLDATWTYSGNYVGATELLPDGRVLVMSDHLERLLPDGKVDTNFHSPYVDGWISSLALDRQGRILIGGYFLTVNGQPRSCLARLTANGDLDPTFEGPRSFRHNNNSGYVTAVVCEPTGEILAAGVFDEVDGVHHPYLVWLDSSGRPLHAAGPTQATPRRGRFGGPYPPNLALQPDGRVWVWPIVEVEGVDVPGIARLFPPGIQTGVQMEIVPRLVPEGSDGVQVRVERRGDISTPLATRLLTRSGTATAGADFRAIDSIVQFAAMETVKTIPIRIFDDPIPEADEVFEVQLVNAGTGEPIAGGGPLPVAILDDDRRGSIDPRSPVPFLTYYPPYGSQSSVARLGEQSGNRLLVSGDLYFASPPNQRQLVRLLPDGSADPAFVPAVDGWGLRVLPDDRLLVWGNSLARLLPDGALDPTFQFNPAHWTNRTIYAVEIQSNGKTLVGGYDNFGGNYPDFVRRLLPDGSLDHSFIEIRLGSSGHQLLPLHDGRVLLYGSFSSVSGVSRPGLAALKPDGMLDLSFAPALENSGINAAAETPEGKILVAGSLSVINGTNVGWSIARFLPDGRLDSTFFAGEGTRDAYGNSANVNALAVLADGGILVGGDFTRFHGERRAKLAFLRPDGTLDPLADVGLDFRWVDYYNPGGYAGSISCLQALRDGRIAVGGWFNRVASTEGYAEMEAPGLIVLNGPAILQFTAAEVLHDGTFRFSLQAEPGGNYVLESSYDLHQWTPVLTNRAYDRVLVFDDLSAPVIPSRFFRAVRQ